MPSLPINGGRKVKASLIDRIQDRHGITICQADQRACFNCNNHGSVKTRQPSLVDNGEILADPGRAGSVYQITSMLEGAVRAGSARRAQEIGQLVAVKRGTTNQERDAWTVGYTPNLVVAVDIGFDNARRYIYMEGGARVALPVFIDYMRQALDGIPSIPFKMPQGMKLVRINEWTGQPAQPGDERVLFEALHNQNFHQQPMRLNQHTNLLSLAMDEALYQDAETEVATSPNRTFREQAGYIKRGYLARRSGSSNQANRGLILLS